MTLIELMSANLKLDETYISSIVSGANFYYRDYCIPKRNGSQRLISQPGPELKTLQYWVVDNILIRIIPPLTKDIPVASVPLMDECSARALVSRDNPLMSLLL